MDKYDIFFFITITVIIASLSFMEGSNVKEKLCQNEAIKAGVAEWVITDPIKGTVDFQYKTNLVEVVKNIP